MSAISREGRRVPLNSWYSVFQVATLQLKHAGKLFDQGNKKAAADCFSEALNILPADPFLLLNLARLQRRAGNPRKAARTARQLQQVAPDYAEAYALAATGYYEGGASQEKHRESLLADQADTYKIGKARAEHSALRQPAPFLYSFRVIHAFIGISATTWNQGSL